MLKISTLTAAMLALAASGALAAGLTLPEILRGKAQVLSASSPDYARRLNRSHAPHIENFNAPAGNPREVDRHPRYIPRDLPRAEPPRRFERDTPPDRAWQPAPRPREFHRDDDRKGGDGHRAVLESRREARPEAIPRSRPGRGCPR